MLFEASSLLVWRLWMLFLTELKPARFTVHNDLYLLFIGNLLGGWDQY